MIRSINPPPTFEELGSIYDLQIKIDSNNNIQIQNNYKTLSVSNCYSILEVENKQFKGETITIKILDLSNIQNN